MAKKKMTDKHKAVAYILHNEYNLTMMEISNLMNTGQSTISSAIKDVKRLIMLGKADELLDTARSDVKEHGFKKPSVLHSYRVYTDLSAYEYYNLVKYAKDNSITVSDIIKTALAKYRNIKE